MSVISNTTVISNLSSIGQLGLLRALYDTINVSVQVYDEIRQGQEEGYTFYAGIDEHIYPFASNGWIRMISMNNEGELPFFGTLPKNLHSGEASCLAIARHRNWTLLTDDQAARTKALELRIRVSGTLGCLLLAVTRKHCTEAQANGYLKEMIDQGYRSPVIDLGTLL